MYPYIHITLPSYGVMAFIGAFFVIIFTFFRLDKYGIEFTEFIKFFIFSIIGGILGSKFLFVITQLPWFINNLSWKNLIILVLQSGYVYYGGLFGVLFTLWLTTRKDADKYNQICGLVIPAIPLFHGLGRIGCMMAGCCYGIKLSNHIQVGFLEFDRVPVQIIEAAFEICLFVFFVVLEKCKSKLYTLENYLVIYAVFRFVIEFFRGDEVRGVWAGGFSTAQYISLLILLMTIKKKMIDRGIIGSKRPAGGIK